MDVASGADRHLDRGLQVVEAHPLFPYFLEKHLAIPTSAFFQLLVNGFSFIITRDRYRTGPHALVAHFSGKRHTTYPPG